MSRTRKTPSRPAIRPIPGSATRKKIMQLWQDADRALEQGRRRDALELYRIVHAMSDQMPSVRLNLIVLLLEFDQWEEAERIQAGFLAPAYQAGQALNAFGVYLDRRHDSEKALAFFDAGLRLDPTNAELHSNKATALVHIHRLEEALDCMHVAIRLLGSRADFYYNRALCYQNMNRLEEALADYAQACELDPSFYFNYLNSANIRIERKEWSVARSLLEQALRIDPEGDFAIGTLAMAEMFEAHWEHLLDHWQAVLAGIDAGKKVTPLLPLLAMPASVVQQRDAARVYVRERVPDLRGTRRRQRRPGRIRLAYVSSDFGNHAVSFLTAGLLTGHDKGVFEVYLMATQRLDDPMRQRLEQNVEHFIDLTGKDDGWILSLARDLDLDLAVDLNGHTMGARPRLFSLGLAPVQINYLGFPGGMGSGYHDYILADAVVISAEDASGYDEKVVHLPGCFQINDDQRVMPVETCKAAESLPEDRLLLASFNGTYKLNPLMFKVWMEILKAVPEAVLVLAPDTAEVHERLRTYAEQAGVSAHRLLAAPKKAYAEHLGRLALMDLILDTLPFNGGTSTSDALWAGVPVLTCTGDTFAGRMSTSLLHHAQLFDLITPDLNTYAATAVALCRDRQRLTLLRERVRSAEVRQRLFASAPKVRQIEAAYRYMLQRHEEGLPPESFSVQGEF